MSEINLTREEAIERIGALVEKLKGDRSVRQMSLDTGVNTSYIARIIKRENLASADVLRRLSEPNTNPKNGITLEDLMIAAGYQKESKIDKYLNKPFDRDIKKDADKYINDTRLKILDSINSNHIFSTSMNIDEICETNFKPDYGFSIMDEHINEWWFKTLYIPKDEANDFEIIDTKFAILLGSIAKLPATMKRKVTIVTNNSNLFIKYTSSPYSISYKGCLSMMLISDKCSNIDFEMFIATYNDGDEDRLRIADRA